jgi:hypothetical protein
MRCQCRRAPLSPSHVRPVSLSHNKRIPSLNNLNCHDFKITLSMGVCQLMNAFGQPDHPINMYLFDALVGRVSSSYRFSREISS